MVTMETNCESVSKRKSRTESSSNEMEFLTNFIANWIKSGSQSNLIDLVDDAIIESRTFIRESLSKLPNQKKIINELDSSTEMSVNQINKITSLISKSNQHLDNIERDLVPLINEIKEELIEQIRIYEEIRAAKESKDNLDYKRIPSYDDFSRLDDASDTIDHVDKLVSLITSKVKAATVKAPKVVKARRASIPDAPAVTDCNEEYLLTTRKIINQDLLEMVDVGSDNTNDERPEGEDKEDDDQFSFAFPKCKISKSALALFDLIMQLLNDAEGIIFSADQDKEERDKDVTDKEQSDWELSDTEDAKDNKVPEEALKLYVTSIKVIRLYQVTVPVINKKLIKSSLTASALLHNNLLFISHFLSTSPQISDAPEEVKESTDSRPGYKLTASLLQDQARDVINEAIREEKYKFVEFFNSSSVVTCLIENASSDNDLKPFEFAIKKSVYLIKSICKSWIDILPKATFNRLIGSLISFIFDEIINKILSIEDISASAGSKMSEIMFHLQKELSDGTLIKPNEGFNAIVTSSFKFNELRNALTASLIDIVNRWGDGYGPLSVAFNDVQVKKLIRALFQNSDIRAAALKKIKYNE